LVRIVVSSGGRVARGASSPATAAKLRRSEDLEARAVAVRVDAEGREQRAAEHLVAGEAGDALGLAVEQPDRRRRRRARR
jgi:hypothetical protein